MSRNDSIRVFSFSDVFEDSRRTRAARPKRIEKTTIARNRPSASAWNGFWNRLTRNASSPPPDEAFFIAASSSRWPAAASRAPDIFGFRRMAETIPKSAAAVEVKKYQRRTEPPNFPDFLSERLAAPMISEKKMIGKTIILSIEISRVPNGST